MANIIKVVKEANNLIKEMFFLPYIMEYTSDIVIVLSSKGEILEFNRQAELFYGYERENVVGKDFEAFCKKCGKEVIFSIRDNKPIKHNNHKNYTYPGVLENEVNYTEWSIVDLLNDNNDILYYIIFGKDISDKIKIEKENNQIKDYLEAISSCMPGNFYWKDLEGHYIGCNQSTLNIMGFVSKSALVGKTDYDLWPEQADDLRKNDREVMETGKIHYLEEAVTVEPGKTMYFTAIKMPLLDKKGKVAGIICNSLDITELKLTQEALKEAKEKAEASSKAKSEFLENMRHDIRTPLSGIIGFSELIRLEAKNKKISEYADNLIASSHALLDLLNEILEMIKVASGDIPLLKKKFNLKLKLNHVLDLYRATAKQKNIDLILQYDETIPNYLIGDSTRVHRIILELVANALNFTQKGYVKISAEFARRTEQGLIIKMTVEDTGVGIAKDKQNEIFVRFKRLTPSYEGIYKGAGLGLEIVKQFIDELQGEIYIESQLKKGTKFICILPLKEALLDESLGSDIESECTSAASYIAPIYSPPDEALEEKQVQDFTIGKKGRILLVEDHSMAANIAKTILTGLDCHVDTVDSGNAAIDMIREHPYDLIFMDVGLPDIDGCEVTRRIRIVESGQDFRVPIIALTAHVDSENKQKCIDAGMNAVLSKPLLKEKASDILNAFIPKRTKNDGKNLAAETALTDKWILESSNAVIDLNMGIKLVDGDENLAKEMIGMLVESFQRELKKLDKYFQQNNWDEIKSVVHKLRGGASYCGTPRLREACSRLENCLAMENCEYSIELYQQLLDEIKAVEVQYKNLQ